MSHEPVSLEALYQELILDHYRRPRNKGTLEHPTAAVDMKNPLCGDEITLAVRTEQGRVAELRFSGHGCSISQASASMMTQLVKGKTSEEVHTLHDRFRAMIMGTGASAPDASLGETRALAGVAKFPARVRCALLAWNALEEVLEAAGDSGSGVER